MAYSIIVDKDVEKVLKKWKRSNVINFKKVQALFIDIMAHPREGIGHPEPLVGGNDTLYSRRISANDRLVYEIHDEEIYVLIISAEGHYDDK